MSDETLKLGSQGDEVSELQEQLRIMNCYQGTVDGQFGPMTEQAVATYREWRGLGYGGEADPDTRAALAADYQMAWGTPTESEGSGSWDSGGGAETGADTSGDPNEGVRQAALSAALGEIGLVRAKESGGADATGEQTRYGWERLKAYFDLAAPGIWPDDTVKYLKPGLPSWCGIFALWALKTGGAPAGDWVMGRGIPGIKSVRDPKPGDIGYIEDNQHYCLVVSIDGDTVNTIDGNTVGDDTGGGEVNDRSRSRSAFAGFYTVFD